MKRTQVIELIAVFKSVVSLEDAEEILKRAGVVYREGMDSSRGKIYFLNTGPKFIVTFKTAEERDQFERSYRNLKEIYELYDPNWKIQKD